MQPLVNAFNRYPQYVQQTRLLRQQFGVNGWGDNREAHELLALHHSSLGNVPATEQNIARAHAEYSISQEYHSEQGLICMCGKHGCKRVHYVTSSTGNVLVVGSTCILRFREIVANYQPPLVVHYQVPAPMPVVNNHRNYTIITVSITESLALGAALACLFVAMLEAFVVGACCAPLLASALFFQLFMVVSYVKRLSFWKCSEQLLPIYACLILITFISLGNSLHNYYRPQPRWSY